MGLSGVMRAEPNMVTAAPTSARVSNPCTNSPMMRSTRHVSERVKSDGVGSGFRSSSSSSVGVPMRFALLSVMLGFSGAFQVCRSWLLGVSGFLGAAFLSPAPKVFLSLNVAISKNHLLFVFTVFVERKLWGIIRARRVLGEPVYVCLVLKHRHSVVVGNLDVFRGRIVS